MYKQIKVGLFRISLALTAIVLLSASSDFSAQLKAKVDKALLNHYQSEGLSLKKVSFKEAISNQGQIELEQRFFKIMNSEVPQGYVYVGQAPSMKNVFDYLVIFNNDLEVEKAKVLIYREQHGRQIGASRWLAQFKGMNSEKLPEFGKNVDGISGATISTKSMTNAVNNLLISIKNAKDQIAI